MVVPRGVEDLVESLGFSRVHRLEWWEPVEVQGLNVTMTPCRHWGARMFRDVHRGYGGYVVEGGGQSVYHSGDTAYFEGFREIGRRLKPEIALLPIGAYFPDSYRSVHTSPEEAVRARLRRLLHRLQLALGDDVLTTDRSTVRWSSAIDLQVDSQLFEQACDRGEFERACRLYVDDFLAGFSPGDSPQFDEWAFFRREALRGRAIQALERVVHDKNASGDYAAAAAHAGRLVELDPLSEVYGRHLGYVLKLLAGMAEEGDFTTWQDEAASRNVEQQIQKRATQHYAERQAKQTYR